MLRNVRARLNSAISQGVSARLNGVPMTEAQASELLDAAMQAMSGIDMVTSVLELSNAKMSAEGFYGSRASGWAGSGIGDSGVGFSATVILGQGDASEWEEKFGHNGDSNGEVVQG